MTTAYEIPLAAQGQQFQLPLNGVAYNLTVTWCDPQDCWVLSIHTVDGAPVLLSIPLQPGDDLLGQHAHLGLGGQLWVQKDGDGNAVPGYSDLGASGHLYYIVP